MDAKTAMTSLSLEEKQKIAKFELFRGLDFNIVECLLEGHSVKQLKHREFFYLAGDIATRFCLVLDGALKLIRHSPRGDDIIVHFALQGDLVGALLMNQSVPIASPISVKSMGPTRIACIPRSTFQNHWRTNLHLQNNLNQILYRRMSNIQDDKTMFTSPLKVRIANLLLRHVDLTKEDPIVPLSLTLTRQELADSLGVAVESIIRSMREMYAEGILLRENDRAQEYVHIPKLLKLIEG